MNQEDIDNINNRYNERLKKHGVSIDALASGKEERRQERFQNLFDIGIKANDYILDLGCGFGDFYFFLEKKLGKGNFRYKGIDINPILINEAKKRLPGVDFLVCDITEDKLLDRFDFILSTSCFNLKLQHQNNYDFTEKILRTSYEMSNKGVAIDFMSSYVDFKIDYAFYYEPEKIFTICKKITKRVMLRHDYPMYEFLMYLYPDFTGWANKK
jgi:SAM-dependent methyltransferase